MEQFFVDKFTSDDVLILRAMFDAVRDKHDNIAKEAMARLFDGHPESFSVAVENASVVPKTRDEVAYSWEANKLGVQVLSTVEKCINRAANSTALFGLLKGLGNRHTTYTGVKPIFITPMVESMQAALYEEFDHSIPSSPPTPGIEAVGVRSKPPVWDDSSRRLWNNLFNSIATSMIATMSIEINQAEPTATRISIEVPPIKEHRCASFSGSESGQQSIKKVDDEASNEQANTEDSLHLPTVRLSSLKTFKSFLRHKPTGSGDAEGAKTEAAARPATSPTWKRRISRYGKQDKDKDKGGDDLKSTKE